MKDLPDPSGSSLLAIAAQLAKDFPTFEAHGLSDVGVFYECAVAIRKLIV